MSIINIERRFALENFPKGEALYILFNTNIGKALSYINDKGDSKIIETSYQNALEIQKKLKAEKNLDLQILTTKEYLEIINKTYKYQDAQKRSNSEFLMLELITKSFEENMNQIKFEIEIHDRNVNGFPSITRYNDENNIKINLWTKLDNYKNIFFEKLAFKNEKALLSNIDNNIRNIKSAYECYKEGDLEKAVGYIYNIISEVKDDKFFVSDLNNSYALRYVAPFEYLHSSLIDDYSDMLNHPIFLFRGRTTNGEVLKERKEMVHRPYKLNEKITRQRFTCQGVPALYLSSTSYACWLELGKPEEDFYVSCFTPNEQGKHLQILNLCFSEELINGIYNETFDKEDKPRKDLQNKMIALFPLVIATSYKFVDYHENKEEYIIPELVMRSIKKLNIDGIAYISKNLNHDLEFQIGTNIVLPVYKENLSNGYGKICNCFNMTKPIKYGSKIYQNSLQYNRGSYIYDIFCTSKSTYHPTIKLDNTIQKYEDTNFCQFDNCLSNMNFDNYLK